MYEDYAIAGKGLRTLFWGQIVAIASLALSLIPLLGFVSLVGLVLALVGLNTAGSAHPGYKNALYMTVGNIILGILKIFTPAALGGILNVISSILSFLAVYYVCTASSMLLTAQGNETQASRGDLIWKLNALCTVVTIACSILVYVPFVGMLAGLVAIISAVVGLVAGILYLMFLYNASSSLGAT